jgi:hypothetical protein
VHEADDPDAFVDFLDTDALTAIRHPKAWQRTAGARP